LSSQAWYFNSPVIEIVLSAETSDRTTSRAFEVVADPHFDARREGGRLLPNLEPDHGPGGLLARWSVLPVSQAKESKNQQNRHGQSQRRYGATARLVRKASRSHSQNSSRCRFLNNRDDSEIPFIAMVEAYGYILRKVAGPIQRSDSHKISQHRDVL
jgi:hypothetical protein